VEEAEEEEEQEQEEQEPGLVLLVGVPRVYSCGSCRAHLASDLDVVSRVRFALRVVFCVGLRCCGWWVVWGDWGG
jgi:hypothetical protein